MRRPALLLLLTLVLALIAAIAEAKPLRKPKRGVQMRLQPFTVESWGGEPVFVTGADRGFGLALFRADESADGGTPAAVRILHLAFGTDREGFAAAQAALREKGVPFRFADHEVSHSIYLRDPDGHQLEITTYDLPGR